MTPPLRCKLCAKRRAPMWRCRSCARLCCEHLSGLKVGQVASCGTCLRTKPQKGAWVRHCDHATAQLSWTSGPYCIVMTVGRSNIRYQLTCDGTRVGDTYPTLADAKEAAAEDMVDKADADAEAVLKERRR